MGQGDPARDFDPGESMENAGILDVFPIFHTARLGQKIRRSPQLPLCGVALKLEFGALLAPPLGELARLWPCLRGPSPPPFGGTFPKGEGFASSNPNFSACRGRLKSFIVGKTHRGWHHKACRAGWAWRCARSFRRQGRFCGRIQRRWR